jgi:hypothetical protein
MSMLKFNPGEQQALPVEFLDQLVSRSDYEDLNKVLSIFGERRDQGGEERESESGRRE